MKLNYLARFLIVAVAVTLYRIYYLNLEQLDLYGDEAQYWIWAQDPAFGYYSKPPIVAWLIAATTKLLGNSVFGIRLASPILHMLTACVTYLITSKISNNKAAWWAGVTYLTLPAVSLSSGFISTDPPLLFFFALSIYCFIHAVSNKGALWWVLLGISFGCGMMSKYNFILFVPCALIYVMITRASKEVVRLILSRNMLLSFCAALLIYLPNFLWNFNNDFHSYHHTKEISKLHQALLYPGKLFEFLGAQIFVIGPVLFTLAARALLKPVTYFSLRNKLLIAFSLPFLGFFCVLSLIAGAYANWAAPSYIALTILAVIYALEAGKRYLLIVSLIMNCTFGAIIYNYTQIVASNTYQTNLGNYLPDPFKRVRGWKKLGQEVAAVRSNYPEIELLASERKLLAELGFYAVKRHNLVRKWGLGNEVKNHFDLTRKLNVADDGKDFLFVSDDKDISWVSKYFNEGKMIKEITVPINQNFALKYKVYLLKHFQYRRHLLGL